MGTEDASDLTRVIESCVAKKVADILKISLSRVNVHRPLNTLGMDSLMAVELKTTIEEDMGIEFPVEALFLGAGISDLTAHILWQRTSGRGLEAEDGPLGKVLSSSRQSGEPTERVCAHRNALEIQPECLPFEDYPEYLNLQQIMLGMKARGIDNPYFRVLEGANGADAEGREHITFSRYNYLGMSGDPVVSQAAKDAIDRYGTSVSASRLASGERPLHRELEKEIADLIGTEDSLAFVSGHATNVTTIGHLFGKPDLIVHDALIHNSVLQGCQLSQATHLSFPHNNWQALDMILRESRPRFRRALVVIEGVYSMDGDIPGTARIHKGQEATRSLSDGGRGSFPRRIGEKGRGYWRALWNQSCRCGTLDGHIEQILCQLRRLYRRIWSPHRISEIHCTGLCLQRGNASAECRSGAGRHSIAKEGAPKGDAPP